jgi:hypothetical protein
VVSVGSSTFYDSFKLRRQTYHLDGFVELQVKASTKKAPDTRHIAQVHCLWNDDDGPHVELRMLYRSVWFAIVNMLKSVT